MKKIIFVLLMLYGVLAFADPLKVAFVYVSPVGEVGWSHQHDEGRQYVANLFGDQIETKYVESVKEGPDSERVIRTLANDGYDLIFATSFGFMNPTVKVAELFPNVIFEHAAGYKKLKNMGTFSPRFYEGRYLAGMAAGSETKSGVIGYVAAFPIPEVVRGINAFTLGAQSVNPEIKVKVLWTNSWFDPGKEREAAKALIAQSADVLTHHTDSAAVVQAAFGAGVKSISYHSNMIQFGQEFQIGAVVHQWGTFYEAKIRSVLEGTWKSSSLWYGIAQGVVDFVLTAELDEVIKKQIKGKNQGIIDGSFHPFQGPIYNQANDLVLQSGKALSDSELLSMNYFVKGVQGRLTQ